MLDMKDGYFELQVLEGCMGADVRERFGELLGRGIGRKGFYWVGSERAKSFSHRVQVLRVPSQDSDGEIAMSWVCEHSTYAGAAGWSLKRKGVNASIRIAR